MEKIKMTFYDFFVFVIPGALTGLGIFIILQPALDWALLLQQFKEVNLPLGMVGLFASYVVGIVIDIPGTYFYYWVVSKIFGDLRKHYNAPQFSKKHRALIREYSKENYFWIQQSRVAKNMCHNLGFVGLVIGIVLLLKSITGASNWFIIGTIFMLSGISLLFRAREFEKDHLKELEAIVSALRLNDRVQGIRGKDYT